MTLRDVIKQLHRDPNVLTKVPNPSPPDCDPAVLSSHPSPSQIDSDSDNQGRHEYQDDDEDLFEQGPLQQKKGFFSRIGAALNSLKMP